MTYPRIYVTDKTHKRVMRAVKKAKTTQKELGDKIAVAGLKALGY